MDKKQILLIFLLFICALAARQGLAENECVEGRFEKKGDEVNVVIAVGCYLLGEYYFSSDSSEVIGALNDQKYKLDDFADDYEIVEVELSGRSDMAEFKEEESMKSVNENALNEMKDIKGCQSLTDDENIGKHLCLAWLRGLFVAKILLSSYPDWEDKVTVSPFPYRVKKEGAKYRMGIVKVKLKNKHGIISSEEHDPIVPKSLKATLDVSVNVNGASLMVDGKEIGILGVEGKQYDIYEGAHEIEIAKKGYMPFKNEISVPTGETLRVSAELVPQSILMVDTKAPGADVFLNKTEIGKAPLYEFVNAGDYKLHVKLKGYLPYDEDIKIVKGKRTMVTVDMLKPKQRVHQAWFWSSTGITVMMGVLSIVYGSKALSVQSDYYDITKRIDNRDFADGEEFYVLKKQGESLIGEMESHALKCDIFLGFTAAFALASTILGFFTSFGKKESKGKVDVAIVNGTKNTSGLLFVY